MDKLKDLLPELQPKQNYKSADEVARQFVMDLLLSHGVDLDPHKEKEWQADVDKLEGLFDSYRQEGYDSGYDEGYETADGNR